jgi:hypothetical protein
MRDVWVVGAGFVFGWLMSKPWSDPECRLGLAIFLVATAVMAPVFALGVVGHSREPSPDRDEDDDGD